MRSKASPSRRQSAGRTQGRSVRSPEIDRMEDLGTETERPLDAEDVALSLLEAKVRAEEARADLRPAEPHVGLTVRLPHAMIEQLRAEAARRSITPSELIKRALMQYRPLRQAARR